MNILIACEFSGRVREAFRKQGHNALSCDLLPSELPGPHYRGDVRKILYKKWDMIIAHPPCTYLCNSGSRWWKGLKHNEQEKAIEFAEMFLQLDCPKICVENPIGILSRKEYLGKPTQIIQPWQYGETECKATCLWLKGVDPLKPTCVMNIRNQTVHKANPSISRWKERSRTFKGIAYAMATQWG